EVRLTEETANQADASAVLNLLHSGDRVAIQDVADATRYMRYVLTADPVDLGVWRTCAVAYETGGGLTIGNNQEVLLLLRVEGPAPAQTAQLAGMAARLTALEARLEALER
ncbi:MAG: hypothetical protein ACRD0M_06365, partial [Acidimicrobiales bacterium]